MIKRGVIMSLSVKLSEKIVTDARKLSKVFSRSIAGQIEHWARVGKIAEENPDLNYDFIKDILISLEEVKENQLEEYKISK